MNEIVKKEQPLISKVFSPIINIKRSVDRSILFYFAKLAVQNMFIQHLRKAKESATKTTAGRKWGQPYNIIAPLYSCYIIDIIYTLCIVCIL